MSKLHGHVNLMCSFDKGYNIGIFMVNFFRIFEIEVHNVETIQDL